MKPSHRSTLVQEEAQVTELTRNQSNAKAGGKGQACERLWEARPWIERSRGRPERTQPGRTLEKCFNLWKLTRTGSLSAHSAKGGREEERVFLLKRKKGVLAVIVTWLILPVVICLSQRLSHACLSTHGRYSETANGSLNQLWFLWSLAPLLLG